MVSKELYAMNTVTSVFKLNVHHPRFPISSRRLAGHECIIFREWLLKDTEQVNNNKVVQDWKYVFKNMHLFPYTFFIHG